jgi:ABC-type sugar transport system ATPase subunit
VSGVSVERLSKRFGAVNALDAASLEVRPGEFFCIVGPSKAGKSTLLRCIAGIEIPDAGRVRIGGRDVTDLEPRARGVSLQFQNNALFPTLTGYDNLAFGLRHARRDPGEVRLRVEGLADRLGIAHLLGRLPRTFSGGEQQRVGLGRALAAPGAVLMLDEPLANLDARIRTALRLEFKALHRETGRTTICVTHDQLEAMSLGERVAVLDGGRVLQVGTPSEVYERPETGFVARFFGDPPMNIVDVTLERTGGETFASGPGFRVRFPIPPPAAGGPVAIGIRAEAVAIADRASDEAPFPADVLWTESRGSHDLVGLRLGEAVLQARLPAGHRVAVAAPAFVGFVPRPELVLDRNSGAFIR